MATSKKPSVKAPKPRCANPECNHVKSFHGKKAGACQAFGCGCRAWRVTAPKKKVET